MGERIPPDYDNLIAKVMVHATDRPNPYCHWANTGSSRDETSTVWAAGLIVVNR